MAPMHALRKAHLLARLVLVWFVASLGVAVAAPLVQGQGMQLVCSVTGAGKFIGSNDDGQGGTASLAMHCPLCAGVSAPPPLAFVPPVAAAPRFAPAALACAGVSPKASSAPPPARAPPQSSCA